MSVPVHTSELPKPAVLYPALQMHVAALLLLLLADGHTVHADAPEALYEPAKQSGGMVGGQGGAGTGWVDRAGTGWVDHEGRERRAGQGEGISMQARQARQARSAGLCASRTGAAGRAAGRERASSARCALIEEAKVTGFVSRRMHGCPDICWGRSAYRGTGGWSRSRPSRSRRRTCMSQSRPRSSPRSGRTCSSGRPTR